MFRGVMHVGLFCNRSTVSLIASCSKHSHLTLLCCIPISSRATQDLLDFFKTRVQSSLQSHSVTSDFITQDIQGYAVWLSPDNTDKSSPSLSLSVSQTHCSKTHTHTPTIHRLEGSRVLVYTHTHSMKTKPLTVYKPPPLGQQTTQGAHGGAIVSMQDPWCSHCEPRPPSSERQRRESSSERMPQIASPPSASFPERLAKNKANPSDRMSRKYTAPASSSPVIAVGIPWLLTRAVCDVWVSETVYVQGPVCVYVCVCVCIVCIRDGLEGHHALSWPYLQGSEAAWRDQSESQAHCLLLWWRKDLCVLLCVCVRASVSV